MTGFRYARIQAGYRTAAEAHKAFAGKRKGREALSLSHWRQMEAHGPRLITPGRLRQLAQFLGCSTNLVFAWSAPTTITTTKKGHDDSQSQRVPTAANPARDAALTKKNRPAQTRASRHGHDPKKVTMQSLPHGLNSGGQV
jgi:hypothetical protein